jgi:hypothetical protein
MISGEAERRCDDVLPPEPQARPSARFIASAADERLVHPAGTETGVNACHAAYKRLQ